MLDDLSNLPLTLSSPLVVDVESCARLVLVDGCQFVRSGQHRASSLQPRLASRQQGQLAPRSITESCRPLSALATMASSGPPSPVVRSARPSMTDSRLGGLQAVERRSRLFRQPIWFRQRSGATADRRHDAGRAHAVSRHDGRPRPRCHYGPGSTVLSSHRGSDASTGMQQWPSLCALPSALRCDLPRAPDSGFLRTQPRRAAISGQVHNTPITRKSRRGLTLYRPWARLAPVRLIWAGTGPR